MSDPNEPALTARAPSRARAVSVGAASEERLPELEKALHAARIGTFDWDIVADKLRYSSNASRIFGSSRPMPRCLTEFLDRIHPADRESVAGATANAAALPGESFVEIEYRVEGDDGVVRWIRGQGRILRDAAQGPARVVGTVMDVSDRKALEIQLFQSQKMEGVGRLAGGVAHDFNNLLTAIFGELELVRSDVPDGSELADSLDAITQAAERARKLTAQLLAFARQQVFEIQESDLNALLSDLSDLLRRVLGEDVRLEHRAGPALWRARVDTHQLEQVILNLSVNGREAMPRGGTLEIETANRPDGECPVPGDHVMISVRDSGMGMPETIRARALEPFFTTKELGTGLGLSTCYGIVEQLGGHLEITSQPGRGTEVQVYLPRCEEPQRRRTLASRSGEASSVVLVVEDEPAVRVMTARGLRKHGYVVLEAAHGAEALARLRDPELSVDVLVSDVVMPEMSGRELAERAAALSPATRVLFVSGHGDAMIERHGLRGGGARFLQKPYTPRVLANKVREILDEPEAAGVRSPGRARDEARLPGWRESGRE